MLVASENIANVWESGLVGFTDLSRSGHSSDAWRVLSAIALSLFVTLGLSVSVGCDDVRYLWSGYDPVWVTLFVALVFVLERLCSTMSPRKSAYLLAFAFALLTWLGKGVEATQGVSFLIPGATNLVAFVMCIGGFSVAYAFAIEAVFHGLDSISTKRFDAGCHEVDQEGSSDKGRAGAIAALFARCKEFARKWPLLAYWVVLVLLWSPWLIAGLPGNVSYDTMSQLAMGTGLREFSTHHPPFLTYVYTALFNLGFAIGGVNGGAFLLSLVQVILFSLVFAYCLLWMRRKSTPRWAIVAAMLFWSLVPVFPIYAQMIFKDTAACAFFALFVLQVALMALHREEDSAVPLVFISGPVLTIVGLLCCLTRNESVYIVVPSLLIAAIVLRRDAVILRSVLVAGAFVLVLWAVWSFLLLPALGIVSGSSREALSLPILQTARCLKDYPDDLTDTELRGLEQVTSADIEEIAAAYDPAISDEVKELFDFDASGALTTYLSVWASMGLRHPAAYLSVLLESTLGYWYPFASVSQDYTPERANDTAVELNYLESHGYEQEWNAMYGGVGEAWFGGFFRLLNMAVYFMRTLPVLGLLCVPGTFVWIGAVLSVYLLANRGKGALISVPLLLKFMTCLVSPLSGSLRYALPIAACLPLLLLVVVVMKKHDATAPASPARASAQPKVMPSGSNLASKVCSPASTTNPIKP